ncbi:tetratricopeptide repeat protein [Sphaerisporangium sp. TRM90804]|uniref:tetratricopeptide repeat protein n=1 Tax=Sphaerisporangium sp. TRM90804 TaxID=3031113 RepID=UPI0024476224|nr:tetratricopeptide repeat protein [Sphaerisporangium sp. TRM90804]MDH2427465.1 tetratricopeptide repeat protein [Sphaerisporangium sp. TRM90804]
MSSESGRRLVKGDELMIYDEYQRGQAFFDAKDFPEAARILGQVVDRHPDNRAAVELLARAYFHSAQLTRAERTLKKLIDLEPANAWAYEALARTLERRNLPDEAAGYRKLAVAMGAEQEPGAEVSIFAADLG